MKCHGCSTLMILDKQETGASSRTQWHSCPLCGKVRLTSEPESSSESGLRVNAGRSVAQTNTSISRKGTHYYA